ncbi:DUF5681 domain-containing protein [Ruegeria atlantica]|uniref:DUF5681 domain-containing protein n=1 Tax=Ruegeria atlantica TaxID=81569 RepID=A0A0P1EC55_9RHOB|nr:DUF5681 domain-containing protein [Ruegeria atlantica]CUH46459.1 hypothetical protein RUA4292_00625 [Ruegeria atlantica]
MSDDIKDDDYEVGYGKPPKATQFKRGRSGNPKGRPKASKNVGKILEDTFFQKVPITENGVRREATMLEAIVRQVANGAAKGDMRNVDRVLKLLPQLQDALTSAETASESTAQTDPQSDVAVLEALADMFGSDPEDLFATVQEGVGNDCPES